MVDTDVSMYTVTSMCTVSQKGSELLGFYELYQVLFFLTGSKKPIPDCIVSVESMNIFPVGWCETNGYQLRPPCKAIGISCVPFAVASWFNKDGETI